MTAEAMMLRYLAWRCAPAGFPTPDGLDDVALTTAKAEARRLGFTTPDDVPTAQAGAWCARVAADAQIIIAFLEKTP